MSPGVFPTDLAHDSSPRKFPRLDPCAAQTSVSQERCHAGAASPSKEQQQEGKGFQTRGARGCT